MARSFIFFCLPSRFSPYRIMFVYVSLQEHVKYNAGANCKLLLLRSQYMERNARLGKLQSQQLRVSTVEILRSWCHFSAIIIVEKRSLSDNDFPNRGHISRETNGFSFRKNCYFTRFSEKMNDLLCSFLKLFMKISKPLPK